MSKKLDLIAEFCASCFDINTIQETVALALVDWKAITSQYLYKITTYDKEALRYVFAEFLLTKKKLDKSYIFKDFRDIYKIKYDNSYFNNIISTSFKQRNFRLNKPIVIYVYGKAGSGKSWFCNIQASEQNKFTTLSNLKWFNGYLQQPVCIFEDFRLSDWNNASLNYFLRLIDRYSMNVEQKGSTIQFNSPFIFINTIFSPQSLMDNYKLKSGFDDMAEISEEDNQLFRRIDILIEVINRHEFNIKINNSEYVQSAFIKEGILYINQQTISNFIERS